MRASQKVKINVRTTPPNKLLWGSSLAWPNPGRLPINKQVCRCGSASISKRGADFIINQLTDKGLVAPFDRRHLAEPPQFTTCGGSPPAQPGPLYLSIWPGNSVIDVATNSHLNWTATENKYTKREGVNANHADHNHLSGPNCGEPPSSVGPSGVVGNDCHLWTLFSPTHFHSSSFLSIL